MVCEFFSSMLSQGVTSSPRKCKVARVGTCHGFMAINPAYFGNPEDIENIFLTNFLQ